MTLHRFPKTAGQLAVLRLLVAVEDPHAWTFLDRHAGKSAGRMSGREMGEFYLVDTVYDGKTKRTRYRITDEGRKALARVEADEAERQRRYDPFGPQAVARRGA